MITQITPSFTGAKTYPIRISRAHAGNSLEQRPFLFNEVLDIVKKNKLPGTFAVKHIDLPNVPQKVIDKLVELKIGFEKIK